MSAVIRILQAADAREFRDLRLAGLRAFIASVGGDKVAGQVQFNAEYFPSTVSYGGFETHAQAPGYVRSRP